MSSFFCSNIQAIINSIGIVFDIAGAWFVAYEVVQKFEGTKINVKGGTPFGMRVFGQKAEETEDFKNWESKKYNVMKWGLGFLTIGFLLQLISNWIVKFVSC